MTDLIKRLDEWAATVNLDRFSMQIAYNLIIDCRAEIEKLTADLIDLKECHQDLLDADNAQMQKLIAEIESDYYTDETAIVLRKYRSSK